MQKKTGKATGSNNKCEFRQLLLDYVTFCRTARPKRAAKKKFEKIFSVTT
jgi:hypothetical protein